MLLGLISDTHGLLRPEVFDAFEGVDHILHAGDVGDEDILVALATIAPVTAVWGNTDGWALRARLPEVATLELKGWGITVVHGHQAGRAEARELSALYPADLLVFGHSHDPAIERIGSTLAVNPGSAGPLRFDLPVSVALATLTPRDIAARHVYLLDR